MKIWQLLAQRRFGLDEITKLAWQGYLEGALTKREAAAIHDAAEAKRGLPAWQRAGRFGPEDDGKPFQDERRWRS